MRLYCLSIHGLVHALLLLFLFVNIFSSPSPPDEKHDAKVYIFPDGQIFKKKITFWLQKCLLGYIFKSDLIKNKNKTFIVFLGHCLSQGDLEKYCGFWDLPMAI